LITAGIDIGSLSAQAAIVRDGVLLSWCNETAGPDTVQTAQSVLDTALEKASLAGEAVEYVVGTGYGRYAIPLADKTVTEISCHARGANYFFPAARTVLDMGGQDCKAIRCDSSGKVKAFVMNDKCAAGTGRSMDILAKLIGIAVKDIGPLSLNSKEKPRPLSHTCVIYAKSEAIQMLRQGVPLEDVLAAYCDALARRTALLIRQVGLEQEFVISGGIAKNEGVVNRIEAHLGTASHICAEPQIVGALGAALIAGDLVGNRNGNAPGTAGVSPAQPRKK
jgi:predicted CoA-substrate-specific enzyme activase